jgi:glyoxylase-like metal-dependent hydrolase (beta-lactamase superfamily II)
VPYTIHPLSFGEVTADTSYLVFGWTPGTKMAAPYLSYLILGGAAPIIVDTGIRVDEGAELPAHRHVGPEHALERQLQPHGVEPQDIGLVVLTHLHADHTGHVDRFPNARLMVQRSELQYAVAPPFFPYMYDSTDVAKLVDPLSKQLELLDGEAEIEPGIRCVPVGGHSPGHQMLYVDLASGPAIIAGDNVCLTEAVEMGMPTGYVVDMGEAMAAVAQIRRDATHILPGHDPKIFATYPNGIS